MYAFDGVDSDIVWVKKLAVPINQSKNIDGWLVNDHWCLISSGVWDQDTNQLYALGWSDPDGNYATAKYYMHVLRLKDGSRVCDPVLIDGVSNGQQFSAMMRKQRSSLCLATFDGIKTIFFACGTVQETSAGAAGFIGAFDVATNTMGGMLALSKGDGAGVWMAGSGVCADSDYLYLGTGNGSNFDGVTNFPECAMKLSYRAKEFKVEDHWTPYTDEQREGVTALPKTDKLAGIHAPTLPVNMAHMNMKMKDGVPYPGWSDEDFNSAGVLLVSKYNMLLCCGKDGILYACNINNMGNTMPADLLNPAANYAKLLFMPIWFTFFPGYQYNPMPQNPTALNFLPADYATGIGKTRHMHSTPVYYEHPTLGSLIYCGGENSPVRAWKLTATGITYLGESNEIASANITYSPGGMPGSFLSLTANGQVPGTAILWVTMPYGDANRNRTKGRMLAYAAEPVNGVLRVLFDTQVSGKTFTFNKFNPMVVSGGRPFLPTYDDETLVFSL